MTEFLPYAALGLLIGVVSDVYASGARLHELNWRRWWGDNAIRLLLSVLVTTAGLLFSDNLIGAPLNAYTAFLTGLGSDQLMEKLVRRKRKYDELKG